MTARLLYWLAAWAQAGADSLLYAAMRLELRADKREHELTHRR